MAESLLASPSDSPRRRVKAGYLRKACTNCRRRKLSESKQKCDGFRPACNQCRIRPPRTQAPCKYSYTPVDDGIIHARTTEDGIRRMQWRIHELEILCGQAPSQVFLVDSYAMPQISPDHGHELTTSPIWLNPTDVQEPPIEVIESLVDIFLNRLRHRGYFFLHPSRLRHSVLPFGHQDRPSAALLSAVYLWSSFCCSLEGRPCYYTEAENLSLTLHNLAVGLCAIQHPSEILQTIQAEVLLSYYYLSSAQLVQGRHHCAVASSLASYFGAEFRGATRDVPNPPFPFPNLAIHQPRDAAEKEERIGALRSLFLLNNFWVAASGLPSSISYDILKLQTSLTARPAQNSAFMASSCHQENGCSKAVGGDGTLIHLESTYADGRSSLALLVKASILLERIIVFSGKSAGLPNPTEFRILACRLDNFLESLPCLATVTGQAHETLLLTHCLANTAILRLHALYSRNSEHSISRAFMAAARFVAGVSGASGLDWGCTDPNLGSTYKQPLISTVCGFYISQLDAVPEAVAPLQILLDVMGRAPRLTPLIHYCFTATYAAFQEWTSCGIGGNR
ncbi:hypothetical protein B0H13DRAFT_2501731 [Mycena leptocephala]|nr:hypothetical protein B0H13DRAFT_2501731 [Mycena leptocephala]